MLILSLLFTIIEGARVSAAKVNAERTLTIAMDSVLAEYYGPLWEEYHIFGFNTGDGNEVDQKEQIATILSEYMSYTFAPTKNLELNSNKDDSELYGVSVNSIVVENETMLMDYQGELLINQAVEYMKYKGLGNGMELLLGKLSLLEAPKKVSAIYEEKEVVEEELVEIDEGILELMELLDGVKTSKKGIEVSKDGALKTSEYFIKMLCFEEVTKDNVVINHNNIFEVLKNRYVNPAMIFEGINSNFNILEQILVRLEGIKSEAEKLSLSLSTLQAQLGVLNSIEKKTKEVQQQIVSVNESISNLVTHREELQKEAIEQETLKAQLVSEISVWKKYLSSLISKLIPLLEEAISITNNLIYKTSIAEPLVNGYEEVLNKAKESLGEDVYAGLEDNLRELKRYTSSDLKGYDFIAMMDTLEYNRHILKDAEKILNQGETELTQELYNASKTTFIEAKSKLVEYQIKDLAIDYSTLVLDKSKQKNPLGEVENILQDGIMSLVIDPETISKAELSEELLPSVLAAMTNEDIDFFSKLTSFFKNVVIGDKNSGVSSLFMQFDEPDQIMSMVEEGINMVAEHVLYEEYLKEHFAMFPTEGEKLQVRKPSVLVYEQEYLLNGKGADEDNLSSVISKIIFYRTILDFVSLLGDKAKCSEAKLAAASLVGFTGLPILIGITQTIILLVWGFVEALVDVCTLMKGKEVPILKKKVVTEFPDLFLINRSQLESKTSQVATGKEVSLSYQDYLRIFLLMKNKEDVVYRSMDLMQENINLRYEDEFHIMNCLFGYQVIADYRIEPKFSGFSFVQRFIDSSVSGFRFSIKAAYSY